MYSQYPSSLAVTAIAVTVSLCSPVLRRAGQRCPVDIAVNTIVITIFAYTVVLKYSTVTSTALLSLLFSVTLSCTICSRLSNSGSKTQSSVSALPLIDDLHHPGYLLNLHKVFQKTLVKTYLTELILCGDLAVGGGLQLVRVARHQAVGVAQDHGP